MSERPFPYEYVFQGLPDFYKHRKRILHALHHTSVDPLCPQFHFRPPCQWMNDPNGTLYYQGEFHLFYQFNPYGDDWGSIHWGHAKSKDLVHWDHLPIGLYPANDETEAHCASGCMFVSHDQQLLIAYTAFSEELENQPYQQHLAVGSQDALYWKRDPQNPLLQWGRDTPPKIHNGWRDPFVFHQGPRTFMVVSSWTEDFIAQILIYEAKDASCRNWEYRGVFFCETEANRGKFHECPNIVEIDGKWVLITSPYRDPVIRPIEYRVGTIDFTQLKFHTENQGILDHGTEQGHGLYATNTYLNEGAEGPAIYLVGWIRGFPQGRGWNGCLSLPRRLRLSKTNQLQQEPVSALHRLRGQSTQIPNSFLEENAVWFPLSIKQQWELQVTLEFNVSTPDSRWCLFFQQDKEPNTVPLIQLSSLELWVTGKSIPLHSLLGPSEQTLKVYRDHSVLEVFLQPDGKESICLTRLLLSEGNEGRLGMNAPQGKISVKAAEVWPLESIW